MCYYAAMPSEADDVMDKMAAAYAACSSYRDTGVVTTTFFSGEEHIQRLLFSTRFVRPDRFCFEYREQGRAGGWIQHALWLDGETVRSWWSSREAMQVHPSLQLAIAAFTGVSSSSSYNVPALLMPELRGGVGVPRRYQLIEVAAAAAAGCLVVEETRNGMNYHRLHHWIDQRSWMLRRVASPREVLPGFTNEQIEELIRSLPSDEQMSEVARSLRSMAGKPGPDVETIVEYGGAFDVEIDPAELTFIPFAK